MIETEDIRLSQERLAALKELITPIKDLAKNWDVDLNVELEKYMSTFESNVNSDNFAEAALVIQGSAGVWSKKVEFLYSLAVDSLGMLEEKERRSKGDCGKEHEDEEEEEEMMTLLPVVIKRAGHVHVDLSSLARSEHFKPRIPLYLSAISVKNDKPENLLYNKKGELLASRDDFAMNNCIINKFGFASLDIQTCLLLNQTSKKTAITPFFKRHVSQYDGFVDQENVDPHAVNPAAAVSEIGPVNDMEVMDEQEVMDQEQDVPITDNIHQDIPEGDDLDPGGALDLCDDSDGEPANQIPVEPNMNEPKTPKNTMQLRSRLSVGLSSPRREQALASKIIQHLNPHEQLPSKPFKKAVIEKPKAKASRKRKKENTPKSSLSELLQSSTKKSVKLVKFSNQLRKPLHPENTELFKKLRKNECTNNTYVRKRLAAQPLQHPLPLDLLKLPQVAESPDSDDLGPEGPDDDDFCGTITENPAPISAIDGIDEQDLNLNVSQLEALEADQQQALRLQDIQPSYEDLVRQHVLKYTTEARNHFHVSELRGRVIEWENKITPILEEEERDTPFDVSHYSNKLLDKLATYPEETTEFKNLVSGEGRGEICRLFLTSLMLTNSRNIELRGTNDEAKCKLLSRKLFSEVLEGYVASSSAEVPSSSSNRKRKNTPS